MLDQYATSYPIEKPAVPTSPLSGSSGVSHTSTRSRRSSRGVKRGNSRNERAVRMPNTMSIIMSRRSTVSSNPLEAPGHTNTLR